MKKLLLSSIVLTMLLSGVASAQTSSFVSNKINEIEQAITDIKQKVAIEKAQLKAEISSTTLEMKDVRLGLKDAIEIKIGKQLDAQKLKIANEFENTIKQLQDLVTRIESRIAKMDASGINTTSSKILFETAKTKISLASTEVTNFENVLSQQIPTASTSTSIIKQRLQILKAIKAESDKTKTSINVAKRAIINTVNSLKPGLQKTISSTSTESTSTIN